VRIAYVLEVLLQRVQNSMGDRDILL